MTETNDATPTAPLAAAAGTAQAQTAAAPPGAAALTPSGVPVATATPEELAAMPPHFDLEGHLRQKITDALASFASRASHLKGAAVAGEIVSGFKALIIRELKKMSEK